MFQSFIKRAIDATGSLFLIIVLSPVMLAAALLIRIFLGSPVIFQQERPGLYARPFILYKFRSMNDARDQNGELLPDKVRLTRLGRFLRHSSIDEFPQLFNIFKGDMSFIGPRPLLMRYLSRYNAEQARRHHVRPGLTGLAQVNGRNSISWEEKFSYDVWYVDHWSLLLDCKIILKSIVVALNKTGVNAAGDEMMGEFWGTEAQNEVVRREIPLSVPNLNHEIVDHLKECIKTGWVSTGGRFISEFEQKVADYVGMTSAVSTQSGTAGLHLALKALGVAPGDEVIAPTLTFIAAINPISYLGANPVFMDCDENFCLDPAKLESFLENECQITGEGTWINRTSKARIKAIVVVHIFGNLCDMEKIMSLSERFGIPVIEDATEALGSYVIKGKYKGKYAGTIGAIGVYSFNANKIITTGGGGMIVSNNSELLEKMRYWSITAKDDALYFVHNEVGYNYRMLNIQAALGVSQIAELESFIDIKIRNYELYSQQLKTVEGIQLLPFSFGSRSNHWFYSLYVNDDGKNRNRDTLMKALIQDGIQCRPVWKLNHKQKPYEACSVYKIEKAHDFEKNILNLPCSTNLSADDVMYVCESIKKARA